MSDIDRERAAIPQRGDSVEPKQVIEVDRTLKVAAVGTFLIVLTVAAYFGRDFLLPVTLGFLFALVLSPVIRALTGWGIPEWASSIFLVLILAGAIGLGLYSLSGPVAQWINDAPRIGREISEKVAVLRQPIEKAADASKRVEELTESQDPRVQRVVLSEPGVLSRAASGVPATAAQIGMMLVLLLFLLASGDMFYEKLVKSLPTLSDKKRGLRIAQTVEREVSRYLFTIFGINIGLGIFIGLGMYAIGMPNPVLWGVAAALLNFIPYVGALIGVALVTLVGLVSFDTLGMALVAPLIYIVCTVIEGQFVTPLIVGRRLDMNPVAIFLAIAFWGWLWGIAGALIAVPLLVSVKVFADHVGMLSALGEFLGARDTPQTQEDEESTPGPRQPLTGALALDATGSIDRPKGLPQPAPTS
jgi:predicted PurR-regulated permease PerM